MSKMTLEKIAAAMEDGFKKSDAKIDRLSLAMEEGFKKATAFTEASIEKLAQMTRDGFAAVDTRFSEHDLRFQRIDERFDSLEQRLNAKIQNVQIGVDDLRAEMNGRFDDVDEEIHGIHKAIDSVSGRVTKLEEHSGFFHRMV